MQCAAEPLSQQQCLLLSWIQQQQLLVVAAAAVNSEFIRFFPAAIVMPALYNGKKGMMVFHGMAIRERTLQLQAIILDNSVG